MSKSITEGLHQMYESRAKKMLATGVDVVSSKEYWETAKRQSPKEIRFTDENGEIQSFGYMPFGHYTYWSYDGKFFRTNGLIPQRHIVNWLKSGNADREYKQGFKGAHL